MAHRALRTNQHKQKKTDTKQAVSLEKKITEKETTASVTENNSIAKNESKDNDDKNESKDSKTQKNPGRCFTNGCKGKISLVKQIMNKCKCGYVYCDNHRLAESHSCQFDHIEFQRDLIAKNNPVVQAAKMEKI